MSVVSPEELMGQFRAAEGSGVCGLLGAHLYIMYNVSLYNQLLNKGIKLSAVIKKYMYQS